MHKKTTKRYRLRESRNDSRAEKMILQTARAGLQNSNSSEKSRSLSSCSQQMEQRSWSEDIEEVAAHHTLEHWRMVEQTLFDEEEQLQPGPLFDECLQWRTQIPHLRLVGQGLLKHHLNSGHKQCIATNVEFTSADKPRNPGVQKNKKSESSVLESDLSLKDKGTVRSPNSAYDKEAAKEKVLDYLVEFVYKKLTEIETENDDQDLSNNFNEFLKISPAPTCTGINPLNSSHFYWNIESTKTLAKDKTTLTVKDKNKAQYLNIGRNQGRNKLGTIFNEKIIVSSVPFVATTTESFSTIRKTPIHSQKDNDATSSTCLGSRGDNTKRRLSLSKKMREMPLMTIPRIQSSWNTPTCSTIWPKNVKLTPIDTSRLPSSKRRSSKTAESVLARRTRNSLSPILRSIQSISPRSSAQNKSLSDALEVRGLNIVTPPQRLGSKVARMKPTCPKLIKN